MAKKRAHSIEQGIITNECMHARMTILNFIEQYIYIFCLFFELPESLYLLPRLSPQESFVFRINTLIECVHLM